MLASALLAMPNGCPKGRPKVHHRSRFSRETSTTSGQAPTPPLSSDRPHWLRDTNSRRRRFTPHSAHTSITTHSLTPTHSITHQPRVVNIVSHTGDQRRHYMQVVQPCSLLQAPLHVAVQHKPAYTQVGSALRPFFICF